MSNASLCKDNKDSSPPYIPIAQIRHDYKLALLYIYKQIQVIRNKGPMLETSIQKYFNKNRIII